MAFSCETVGVNTFLVYSVHKDDILDSLGLGMITNNKIPGFSQVIYTQMDEEKFLKYNISSKVSAKQFFTGAVNKKRLLGVFSSIASALISSEEYMLDTNTLLLDLEYIYADVTTCDAVLICVPIMCMEKQSMNIGGFFKNIMFSTQFDQTENCDYVAKIINYLNSTPIFSLVDFKRLIDELSANNEIEFKPTQTNLAPRVNLVPQEIQAPKDVQPQVQNHTPVQQRPVNQKTIVPKGIVAVQQPKDAESVQKMAVKPAKEKKRFGLFGGKKKEKQSKVTAQTSVPSYVVPGMAMSPATNKVDKIQSQSTGEKQSVKTPSNIVPQTYVQPQQNSAMPQQSANFGETTLLGGGSAGETTVLGVVLQKEVKPFLVRTKNTEKITLDKPVFRIGKEKSYVDYFIGDNTAISRSHANFITRDGEYFVVDTNSTNHTYVNGAIIQSNVEAKLAHGSRITLANEDFEFKIY